MGNTDGRETCGRCSVTTVVDAVEEDKPDPEQRYDPYGDEYIEIDERELRFVSLPAVYAGKLKRWLDRQAHRIVHDH